jgi:uncharacterized protein
LEINVNLPWSAGEWTHPPISATEHGDDLLVTAAEGSDAWRVTSYGFIRDSEHALVASFPSDSAMEVEFTAAFSSQFDQAGIFVLVSPQLWVKAGVEFTDGRPHVGAVVTNDRSDWSLSPVPDWTGKRVVIRVSWVGDALTIRAKAEHSRFQLVRVLPFGPDLDAFAGPRGRDWSCRFTPGVRLSLMAACTSVCHPNGSVPITSLDQPIVHRRRTRTGRGSDPYNAGT